MAQSDKQSWQDMLAGLKNDLPSGGNDDSIKEDIPKKEKPSGCLDVILEKKGRGGKIATIIAGFDDTHDDDKIADIAATLKKKLGTGGSSRGGEILIQGDRRDDVIKLLEQLGYKARKI